MERGRRQGPASESNSAARRLHRRSRSRFALLVVILLGLAFYKTTFTRFTHDTQRDGGYYTNIADNVRRGEGLTTNICLIHKGCETMPHPADIYPLWPLVYGNVARFFPLFPTGKWLATAFYFASLVFGYLWASTLVPGPLIRSLPSIDAGHVFVLMLGLDKEFFKYTTYPYSDGLATTLVLVVLWRACTVFKRPSWRTGLELGVLLGLGFVARTQTLVMALAAGVVLVGALLALPEQRKRYGTMAVTAAVSFCAVVSPHYFHLRSFVPGFGLGHMLRFDKTRFSDVLTPVPVIREVDGLWAYLADRWQGFPDAFALGGINSYRDHMYNTQYALPLALLLLVVLAIRHARRDEAMAGWQWMKRPESFGAMFSVLVALGGFFSLHMMHMHTTTSAEWLFGGRWAVSCVYIFFLSIVLLFRHRSVWRLAAIFIVCTSAYDGIASVRKMANAVDGHPRDPDPPIVAWLNEAERQQPGLIVADRSPQPFAYLTPGVNYHWFYGGTSLADIEAMVTELGVSYLIAPRESFAFMRPRKRFDQSFELHATVGKINIYQPTQELLGRRRAREAR